MRAADDLVSHDPLREAAHLLLARAQASAGDRAGALATLANFHRRYAEELGLDPSPALDDLQRQILDGGLDPIPTLATDFVGRAQQLSDVQGHLRSPGSVVLITGPPGAGKSRFLAEVLHGQSVLRVRAFLAERRLPLSVVRGLLREAVVHDPAGAAALPERIAQALADLVPELPASPAHPLDPESRQALIVEGTVRLLGADPAALVVVDDLQWADATSLTVLAAVAERVDRLRLVLACRENEVPEEFMAGLWARRDVVAVPLAALTAEAIGELIVDPELAAVVAEHTDRSPFAVTELLRGLAARAMAQRIGHRGWTATGWRAVGIAAEANGDVDTAEAAYRESLALSTGLTLFSAWAHARIALVLVRSGRPAGASAHIEAALQEGPGLAHHEARWAAAELAAATGDPHACTVIDDALGRAQEAGYLSVVPRLTELRATVAAPARG